jgi:hypothetical protein
LAETVILVVLIVFTFVAGDGLWESVLNSLYIFFFPFILLFYVFYYPAKLAFAIIRRAIRINPVIEIKPEIKKDGESEILTAPLSGFTQGPTESAINGFDFISRPFRRFTFLWCVLLVISIHKPVLWMSLVILMLHIGRALFKVFKMSRFSSTWLARFETSIRTVVDQAINRLLEINFDRTPLTELRTLLLQLRAYERVAVFSESPIFKTLVRVAAMCFLGIIYARFAYLFAFAYYGLSRLSGTSMSLADAFITSAFILAYASTISGTWVKLLGGIHFVCVAAIGVSTVVSYFRSKIESMAKAVNAALARLSDAEIQRRYIILRERVEANPEPTAPSAK